MTSFSFNFYKVDCDMNMFTSAIDHQRTEFPVSSGSTWKFPACLERSTLDVMIIFDWKSHGFSQWFFSWLKNQWFFTLFHIPHAPCCWDICLHNWTMLRANVGKYSKKHGASEYDLPTRWSFAAEGLRRKLDVGNAVESDLESIGIGRCI